MQRNVARPTLILLLFFLLVGSTTTYSLDEDVIPRANIELFSPETASFKGVRLYREENNVSSVRGRVVRALKTGKKGGRVALTLIQGGRTFYTNTSEYIPLGQYHHRKRGTFFKIDIPFIPNENTKILVQYYLSTQPE
ncbi:MAG: hypothetical protein MI976_14040 [Pseudomonadales bacterium]|nr:hypothetical protein [Pseudomonadales bacterium]